MAKPKPKQSTKKPTPKRPSHKQPTPTPAAAAVGMDPATARRLTDAYIAADPGTGTVKTLPGGGFWVQLGQFGELVYEPGVLIARRSPIGFPSSDRDNLEERAASTYDQKRVALGDARPDVVALHAQPKAGWFLTLRKDFVDPAIAEKKFVDAVKQMTKLTRLWRR